VSIEAWGVLIGGASLLLSAGALFYAWRASRSGDRSAAASERAVSVSEEQLRLAREQAEMRPNLAVYLERVW
jgi:hypothetical protein